MEISLRLESEVVDVSVEYIELPPERPAGGEEVIVIEHEPELQAEVPPPEADQGKHRNIYAH